MRRSYPLIGNGWAPPPLSQPPSRTEAESLPPASLPSGTLFLNRFGFACLTLVLIAWALMENAGLLS